MCTIYCIVTECSVTVSVMQVVVYSWCWYVYWNDSSYNAHAYRSSISISRSPSCHPIT